MTKQDIVAATEAKYGVRLPREYAEFLKNGLYRDRDLVLDGGPNVYFVVVDKVHGHSESALYGDDGDAIRGEIFASALDVGQDLSTFVPFARLGDEDTLDSGALAIDVSRAKKNGLCPVLLYEHDDGSFEEVAASIEEFLEACEENGDDDEEDDDDDE